MKFKIEDLIVIQSALIACSNYCASAKDIESNIVFGVAKNLQLLKPIIRKYDEDNEIRINAFVKKDDKENPVLINNKFDWGENKKAAEEEYKRIISEEVEIDFIKIRRTKQTDKFPAVAQAELLDIVIIEKE
jgi:hypothetical protein